MSDSAEDVTGTYRGDVGSVNEVAVVGDFGFQRLEGPYTYEKDGTVWAVVIPLDDETNNHPITQGILSNAEGEAAVAVADGEVVAGGIVEDVVKPEGHDEVHLAVDQYARGDPDV